MINSASCQREGREVTGYNVQSLRITEESTYSHSPRDLTAYKRRLGKDLNSTVARPRHRAEFRAQ